MKVTFLSKSYDIYFILSILLVIILFLSLSLVKQEPAGSNGISHPSIENMMSGGDGAARIHGFKTHTYVLFACTLLILIAFMVLGVSSRHRTKRFWAWIVLLSCVIVYVWYNLFSSYFEFISTGKVKIYMGFPEPTAWMVYGIWAGGALFVLFYVIGFRKFIYTKEDEAELEDIAKEYSKKMEG